ncbi:MAG: transporter substrate-binding domain-containing protein [Phycisphaerales bacterium]|nr:transporter substrate-binding domain-containing protein [Phycisphaerales bacterium]
MRIQRGSALALLILVSFATWAAILAPAGCERQTTPGTTQADTLAKVRQSKELHVGYFLFEPTIMEDRSTGELKGVFIDMIESIGKALGAKVVYHKVDLANFAAGLQSHQFDLSIGATFATPQRATAVAFTNGLFYCGYTGVVKKGDAARFSTWQDLDKAGLRVAVKQGSAIDDFVRVNFRNADVVRLEGPDLTLPLAAVSAGQADVGLMNQLTVFTYLRAHPELDEVLARTPIASTYFSWAIRQEDENWLRFINTCIDYYQNTGDFFYWTSKYGVPLMHRKAELEFPEMSYPEYWRLRKTN